MRPRLRSLFAFFVVVGVAPVVSANDLDVTLRLESDWMYHGFSEFQGAPAAAFAIDWQSNAPWFIGAVIAKPLDNDDLTRPMSNTYYVGGGWSLTDRIFATGTWQRRDFPGARGEWDYQEFEFALDLAVGGATRLTLRADYSDDYYSVDADAWSVEADVLQRLGDRFYALGGLGQITFSNNDRIPDYQYGQLGVGWRTPGWSLDIAWRFNSESSATTIGVEPFTRAQWVARVSWQIL